MTLEWLRRHDAKLDEVLRTYLFTEGPITELEKAAVTGGQGGGSGDGTLGLGNTRQEES
jgi:hypothetical protein